MYSQDNYGYGYTNDFGYPLMDNRMNSPKRLRDRLPKLSKIEMLNVFLGLLLVVLGIYKLVEASKMNESENAEEKKKANMFGWICLVLGLAAFGALWYTRRR